MIRLRVHEYVIRGAVETGYSSDRRSLFKGGCHIQGISCRQVSLQQDVVLVPKNGFTRTNSLSISAHVSQCGNARMRCNEIAGLQQDRLQLPFESHLLVIEQGRLDPGRWPTICNFLGLRDLSNGAPCGLNVAT